MLAFSPQIWTSDDTDPVERLAIQGGLSLMYPQSAMGAHVSEAPHQQTLRDTPLATRFHAAAFGCLGYELDLKYLSFVQRRDVARQIAFYKEHRATLQYGTFWRGEPQKGNKVVWHSVRADRGEAVTGFFQTQATASEGFDRLKLMGLDGERRYVLATRPQSLYIKRFGGLVKHLLPVALNPDGFILRVANRFFCLEDCVETYLGYGEALMGGVLLNNQFIGTGYNRQIRLLGDFGSNLYVTQAAQGVTDTAGKAG